MRYIFLVLCFFVGIFQFHVASARSIIPVKYNCSVFERNDMRPANVIYETSFEVVSDHPFYKRIYMDQSKHVMIDVGVDKNQGVTTEPLISLAILSKHSFEKSATSFYPLGVFPIALYYAGLNKGIVCNKGN